MSQRAIELGLAVCSVCRTITDQAGEPCLVCGKSTPYRNTDSLQYVWAWWIAGLIAYIPGNLYPIMITSSLGNNDPVTIVGGIKLLLDYESYLIAAVIFLFSVAVPLSKFAIIAWLALGIQLRRQGDEHARHKAHTLVEFVGRWSMVDVFVVAALATLIQIGGLISIYPGLGINAFAASVMCTMLSAMSFDPRLIWDRANSPSNASQDGGGSV